MLYATLGSLHSKNNTLHNILNIYIVMGETHTRNLTRKKKKKHFSLIGELI